MPSSTQLSKWGHSLAVRIPRSVVKDAGLVEGDRLSLEVSPDGKIVMRAARPKYELEQLVSGIRPGNRHAATDWGPPAGKESW
jgi:antitoxin MazE